MLNLITALNAAGAALTDVVRATVYVASPHREDLVAAWSLVWATPTSSWRSRRWRLSVDRCYQR